MLVTIPQIFGVLFPEYAWCIRKLVRLVMSMYGTMLCGKYWYLDLLDFLKEIGFKEGGMCQLPACEGILRWFKTLPIKLCG
jgi:hypothetical protein